MLRPKRAVSKAGDIGRYLTVCLVLACLIGTLFAPAASAAPAGQLMLPVQQVFESDGLSAPPSQAFTYLLKPQTPNAPMPSGSEAEGYRFTISGTREIEVGPIFFSASGIYVYELKCITDNLPGYTIDRQVYTIEVHVTNDLTAILLVYAGADMKVSDLLFEHIYGTLPSDPNAMIDPPVMKTVTGNPSATSTFTFRLTAEHTSNPMPTGSVNGMKTITIIGAGQAMFGTWSYPKEGTFRYTVSEVNSGIAGYTYDTSVYTITDVVTAVDGQLVVSRTITNDAGQEVSSLSFVNTYTHSDTPNPPESPNEPNPPSPPNQPNPPNPPGNGSPISPGKPGDGPKTGDFSNPVFWITVIAVSSALLALIFILVRKASKPRASLSKKRCGRRRDH